MSDSGDRMSGQQEELRRLAGGLPTVDRLWELARVRPEIDVGRLAGRARVSSPAVAVLVGWLVVHGAALDLPGSPAAVIPRRAPAPGPTGHGGTPAWDFGRLGEHAGLDAAAVERVLSALVAMAEGEPAVLRDPADPASAAIVFPRPRP